MLGAQVFIPEFFHLRLGGIECLSQVRSEAWLRASVNGRAPRQLGFKLLFKRSSLRSSFCNNGPNKTIRLPEQSQQEVLVGNLRVIRS